MNSTAVWVCDSVIPEALALLPASLDTARARIMLLAIGLQESKFEHRRQVGGPALGFWQFESGGGVQGVLTHAVTKPLITPILKTLRYAPSDCYYAIEHNDVLACVFARLNLLWHPKLIPGDAGEAWLYYLECWRPGKPQPQTWARHYADALNEVSVQ